MDKPIIADNKPIEVQLNNSETYYWCSCGKSENQPFCNGSHEGTGIKGSASLIRLRRMFEDYT